MFSDNDKAKQILESLAKHSIYRNSLSKYCLVVYPPRNAVQKANEQDKERLLDKIANLSKETEVDLYVHVPYCSRACTFCNFYFLPGLKNFSEKLTNYLNSIEAETKILGKLLSGKAKIRSVYFGGGSPSLLKPQDVKRILNCIRNNIGELNNLEISLELHPEIVRLQVEHYLQGLKDAGVNRVSIGLQSSNNEILKQTRRGHTKEESFLLLESTKKLGFVRNVDLMWGFSGQTIEDHRKTLEEVIRYEPDSITTYFLEMRPTSSEYKEYEKLISNKVYYKKVINMGITNHNILEKAGYNEKTFDYWFKGRDFEHRKRKWSANKSVLLTLGPGTYNWIFLGETDNVVFFKNYDLVDWANEVEQGNYAIDRCEFLNKEETIRRHSMFSLRQNKVSKTKIDCIPELTQLAKSLINKGLMINQDEHYKLTPAGKLINHEISNLFISESVLEKALNNLGDEELRYGCFTHPKFIKNFKNFLLKK